MQDYENAGFFKIIKKEYSFGESIQVGLKRFSSEMDLLLDATKTYFLAKYRGL